MPAELQLREIFNALGDGVFVASPAGRYIGVNPAGCAMFGYEEDEFLDLGLQDLLPDEELPRLRETLVANRDGQVRRSEWLFKRKDGSLFVGELVGGRLPDGRLQSIVRDITESKDRERFEEAMRRESVHRTKNILAIVLAVARQSAKTSPDDFFQVFEKRMSALSASHDLLVRNSWGRIDVASLVDSQLRPFLSCPSRLTMVGEPIEVGPRAAQCIGMALHELATNAVKYGSLSVNDGGVAIGWTTEDRSGQPHFEMVWKEHGGPPVVQPDKAGFGTGMIQRIVNHTLGSRPSLDFHPSGLRWALDCPMEVLSAH